MSNFIKNRIYQIKDTEKFWMYINDRVGFETLDGAPCWWEGEIEFIDTNKDIEKVIMYNNTTREDIEEAVKKLKSIKYKKDERIFRKLFRH